MKTTAFHKVIFTLVLSVFISPAWSAQTTAKGKITYTQGHSTPTCRTLEHKENDTGTIKHFRIPVGPTNNDINAVALAALMAERDVTIWYDPNVTTGCGVEPAVAYITIY